MPWSWPSHPPELWEINADKPPSPWDSVPQPRGLRQSSWKGCLNSEKGASYLYFSRCGRRPASISSIAWELVRNTSPRPSPESETPPAICVLTSPPGGFCHFWFENHCSCCLRREDCLRSAAASSADATDCRLCTRATLGYVRGCLYKCISDCKFVRWFPHPFLWSWRADPSSREWSTLSL